MKTISNSQSSQTESRLVKYSLIFIAVAFLLIMLVVPLITIFVEAFRKGYEAYFLSFNDEYVLSAIKLTFITAAIAVPLKCNFWNMCILGNSKILFFW